MVTKSEFLALAKQVNDLDITVKEKVLEIVELQKKVKVLEEINFKPKAINSNLANDWVNVINRNTKKPQDQLLV